MSSIFAEVGKIIVDEAGNAGESVSSAPVTKHKTVSATAFSHKPLDNSSIDQTPPPIEGDIVMDGEDILRVVVVNHIVPYTSQDSQEINTDISESEDEDLSFWAPEEPSLAEEPMTEVTSFSENEADVGQEESVKKEDNDMSTNPTQKEVSVLENTSSSGNIIPQTSAQIEGDISLPAGGTVSADIRGNVSAKGELHFYGTIDGNVEAEDLFLKGTINGTLKCRKLTMMPIDKTTISRINGAITADALYTEFS